MGVAGTLLIRPRAALVLGRVSNLPTVVSNALAGLILAGAPAEGLPLVLAALVPFYLGGMYLNDAFDAEVDARERPGRPIPSGTATRQAVFAAGFVLMGLGLAVTVGAGAEPAGLALFAAILVYDAVHKHTVLAPVIMGVCRLLCYVSAAVMLSGQLDRPALIVGAAGLFAHVVGLTYAARREAYDRLEAAWPLAVLAVPLAWALWSAQDSLLALALCAALAGATGYGLRLLFRRAPGDVPRAVGLLIAAIPLYDAVLIAAAGSAAMAIVAALCFPATLALHRVVPGT